MENRIGLAILTFLPLVTCPRKIASATCGGARDRG